MDLVLTPEQVGVAFKHAYGASVVAQNSNRFVDNTGRDLVIRYIDLSPAKVHTSGLKTEGDDTVTPVEVPIRTVYKLVSFDDRDFESNDEISGAVVDALPGVLSQAMDQYAFGVLDGLSTPIITNTTPISANIADWENANDELNDAGFTADTWLLDNRLRGSVRKVLNDSTQRSEAAVSVQDGVSIFDGQAYFRKRLIPAGSNVRGAVYDSEQLLLVTQPKITINLFDPNKDLTARLQNRYYAYVGIRMGIALADENAAARLVLAGS